MGPLGITAGHDSLNAWQVLAVEFVLTFVVVFTTFATYDDNRRSFGSDSLSIGIAYLVASLTGVSRTYSAVGPESCPKLPHLSPDPCICQFFHCSNIIKI